MPTVDTRRCEGKADCVRVCPFEVFEIRSLTLSERRQLPVLNRAKLWVHGGKQAFVVNPDRCYACNLCVVACPEDAITLTRFLTG